MYALQKSITELTNQFGQNINNGRRNEPLRRYDHLVKNGKPDLGPLESRINRVEKANQEIFGKKSEDNLESVAAVLGGLYKQEICTYNSHLVKQALNEFTESEWSHSTLTRDKYKSADSARTSKTIAIGGAKGGIGKSLFATNLAVSLANKGYKTLIVDLDLGAPNLHLYFGETNLDRTVNDLINRVTDSVEELIIKTKYGPYFLGGRTAQLGAANITFAQKIKLIKSLKQLQADFVIFDLGGGTHYNIIDFFLSANHGIVVTTSDPASYLDAYNFIKLSLYRKLNRLFGQESSFELNDKKLQYFIQSSTSPVHTESIKSISELLLELEKEFPQYLSYVKKVIDDFKPNLVMNRIKDNVNENRLFNRINSVADQMLHIKIKNLGSVPYQSSAEMSTQELIPIVAKEPQGVIARCFNDISDKLIHIESSQV
ncbi:MAG: MinD/ParA family ATP-binding protein [Gammaproteobacteria bacterium]